MFRTVLTVAALTLASAPAFAGKSVKPQFYFDLYVKEVKSLYNGLKSYGLDSDTSYTYANSWVGKSVFGWDMTMGTTSSWLEDNPDIILMDSQLDLLKMNGQQDGPAKALEYK